MNPADHRTLRSNLGAYALGQLPPDEARQLEEHLASCALCRAEHAELLPVVDALVDLRSSTGRGLAPPEADGDVAPPYLQDRVVGRVREEGRVERRRTWLKSAGLVAAGAAAASVVLGAAGGLGDGTEAPVEVPVEAVEVRPQAPGIEAEAGLVAHTWGTEVKLIATGFDAGSRYRVLVLGEDGRTYPAGGFVGTGTAEMTCNLNSTVLRDSASGFEVRDDRGRVVVSSTFEA